MRIERVRGFWEGGESEFDVRPGSGLVGWVGGSSRDRRSFSDRLRRFLGLVGDVSPPEDPVMMSGAGGAGSDAGTAGPDPRPTAVGADGASRRTSESGPGADRGEIELVIGGRSIILESNRPRDAASLLHEHTGLRSWELALAWSGDDVTDPETLWRAGSRLLANRRDLGKLDAAVVKLGGRPLPREVSRVPTVTEVDEAADDHGAVREELGRIEARLEDLSEAPARMRSLEEELQSLRADHAEVIGDLEVATMDWLRERQDAETHLQQYRDRARELRSRMAELDRAGPDGACPICGRALGDHLEQVRAELQDDWERLVQDGSWWRRRRDQLELKPEGLQELERRAFRLQSEVEACAERLERSRFELREWDELRGRREELMAVAGLKGADGLSADSHTVAGRRRETLLRAFEAAREELVSEQGKRLVTTAGPLLNRISGGRILGFTVDPGGGLAMVEDGRIVPAPTIEDRAAAVVALQLALVLRLSRAGVPLDSMLVAEASRGLATEARLRLVEVLRGVRDRIPQILLFAESESVESVPDRFDHILELRSGRRSLERRRGGLGRIRLDTNRPVRQGAD